MKRYVPFIVVCVLAFGLAASSWGFEVQLEHKRHLDRPSEHQPAGYTFIQLSATPPPGAWKLPKLASKEPGYAMIKLGDREHLMVLDRRQPKDKSFNILYFDSNADGDLENDYSVHSRSTSGSPSSQFPKIDAIIKVDGKELPYTFQPNIYFSGSVRNSQIYFSSACSYEARFELAGKQYRMALEDSNCNGRFDEVCKLPANVSSTSTLTPSGDYAYLTEGGRIDRYDRQPLGNMLVAGRNIYKVEVLMAEEKLVLTPMTEDLFPLKVPTDFNYMSLCSKDTSYTVMSHRPEKTLWLPAGEYRFASYQILRSDSRKANWRLNASASGNTPFVSVGKGLTPVLAVGEPYTPAVTASRSSNRSLWGKSVSLSFQIKGAGQETITDLYCSSGRSSSIPMSRKNSSRPKEPDYTIIKADGEVVKRGSFEYG